VTPVLETDRLILREWRESDLANFSKFKMDKDAARFVTALETVGDCWREMAYFAGHWLLRGFGNWSIELKETGENIGQCGPYYPQQWPEPEIGWAIFPQYQRQGYGYEAAMESLRYARSVLGWSTAISLIANENAPSIALAQKLGAVAERPFHYRNTDCTIYRHHTSHFHTH
jgi:RimJ/RimL family protein N-acetyltransferase